MLHCEHFVCSLSLLFNPFCCNVLGQKKKKENRIPLPSVFVPHDFSLLCLYAFLIVIAPVNQGADQLNTKLNT